MSHARKLRLLFLLIAMCSVFIITYEGNFLLVSDRGKCVCVLTNLCSVHTEAKTLFKNCFLNTV